MGILDFNTVPAASNQRSNNSGRMPFGNLTQVEQPKAEIWMNIGYDVDGVGIHLPIGLPIDTMKPAELRGHNEDFLKQQAASNELLAALQRLGATLQPGQEKALNLTVKLRRVKEKTTIDKADNQYSVNLESLLVAAE